MFRPEKSQDALALDEALARLAQLDPPKQFNVGPQEQKAIVKFRSTARV